MNGKVNGKGRTKPRGAAQNRKVNRKGRRPETQRWEARAGLVQVERAIRFLNHHLGSADLPLDLDPSGLGSEFAGEAGERVAVVKLGSGRKCTCCLSQARALPFPSPPAGQRTQLHLLPLAGPPPPSPSPPAGQRTQMHLLPLAGARPPPPPSPPERVPGQPESKRWRACVERWRACV